MNYDPLVNYLLNSKKMPIRLSYMRNSRKLFMPTIEENFASWPSGIFVFKVPQSYVELFVHPGEAAEKSILTLLSNAVDFDATCTDDKGIPKVRSQNEYFLLDPKADPRIPRMTPRTKTQQTLLALQALLRKFSGVDNLQPKELVEELDSVGGVAYRLFPFPIA